MGIDHSLLLKIKNNLRISHSALDEDLTDTVTSCLADLRVCGVKTPELDTPADSIDPLILNAIKLYCRAEFIDDTAKAAVYKERYDSLKSSLMMAEGYGHEQEATADE
jgi:hypothetical protein